MLKKTKVKTIQILDSEDRRHEYQKRHRTAKKRKETRSRRRKKQKNKKKLTPESYCEEENKKYPYWNNPIG